MSETESVGIKTSKSNTGNLVFPNPLVFDETTYDTTHISCDVEGHLDLKGTPLVRKLTT